MKRGVLHRVPIRRTAAPHARVVELVSIEGRVWTLRVDARHVIPVNSLVMRGFVRPPPRVTG